MRSYDREQEGGRERGRETAGARDGANRKERGSRGRRSERKRDGMRGRGERTWRAVHRERIDEFV